MGSFRMIETHVFIAAHVHLVHLFLRHRNILLFLTLCVEEERGHEANAYGAKYQTNSFSITHESRPFFCLEGLRKRRLVDECKPFRVVRVLSRLAR